jgi:hypothetical protein
MKHGGALTDIARAIGIGLMLTTLGACTQTAWNKPDTPPDVAAADENVCRASAQQEVQRDGGRYALYPDYQFAPYYGGPYSSFSRAQYEQAAAGDRFYLRNRLVDYCMHIKGYERVPVKPA